MHRLELEKVRELVESGAVHPAQPLVDIAVTRHPGGRSLGFEYGEDEGTPGRYVIAVEVEDTSGDIWNVELDARTGEVLEDENMSD
ncbi:PepSY domain-containing protein [Streptomyces chrestomyceticus]|uniref:PepSY domain-containing protein n=1 Tax=Streptomyces chrestomyceticus TaxID=68185 RepID=UPI003410E96A